MPNLKVSDHLHNFWSRNNFPFSMEDCILYAPLGQEDMQGTAPVTYDSSRSTLNVTNTVWGSTGRVFAGNGYLIGVTADFRSTDSLGTLVAVFKTATTGTIQTLFASCDEGLGNDVLAFRVGSGNQLQIRTVISGTQNVVTGGTTVTDGLFHFAALTSDSSDWAIILENAAESLTETAGSNTGDWFADIPGRDNFSIGTQISTSIGNYFTGTIGEIIGFSTTWSLNKLKELRRVIMKTYA